MDMGTVAFYDSNSQSYSDSTFPADTSHLREPFVSLLEPGSRILDLGCGSGRDSLEFHKMGFIVDPVDGSEGMCRVARINTGLPVRRMLFSELDSLEEYDGVWACASLLHLPKDELVDAFHRIHRALRPGGVFYASFKDGDFQGMRDGRYYTDLTVDVLLELGVQCGFQPVRGWNSLEPGRDLKWSNAVFRRSLRRKDINPPRRYGAMAFDGRAGIIDIDEDDRTVIFDTYKLKKITGTRVGPILGISDFSSPFKVACEMAGLYPGDKPNKYIEAGNILEPVIRKYLEGRPSLLREALGLDEGAKVGVEEPVPKEQCGYDHFHNERVFGGMVDGYIQIDGKRSQILEIKTSGDRTKWEDGNGGYTNVPMAYMLQASLYAQLSNLDKIVFLVGFLEEPDYARPKQWVPSRDNTFLIVKDRLDMTGYMADCVAWYDEYMKGGYTPQWTDSDTDREVLKYLKAYKRR